MIRTSAHVVPWKSWLVSLNWVFPWVGQWWRWLFNISWVVTIYHSSLFSVASILFTNLPNNFIFFVLRKQTVEWILFVRIILNTHKITYPGSNNDSVAVSVAGQQMEVLNACAANDNRSTCKGRMLCTQFKYCSFYKCFCKSLASTIMILSVLCTLHFLKARKEKLGISVVD